MTSVSGADAEGARRSSSDAAGVVVLAACAGWAVITAAAHDGRPEGVLLAVLAVTAGHAAGRMAGAVLPVAAPSAGAMAGIGLAVAVPHLTPGAHPGAPLGHSGAVAALLTLATGAACCAAWSTTAAGARWALGLLGTGAVVTAGVLGSAIGVIACAGVLLCSLAAGRMRRRGAGLAGLALAAAAVTGAVWAVAARRLPDGLAVALEGQLTAHRVELWHDALDIAGRDAGLGAGPGRFGELSPAVARLTLSDGKPHSAPLQQLAEQGVVGVLLLGAAFCWMLVALWRTARPTPVALTAGAALTALAGIAAVGNALSFTTVSAGAGLLLGLATARPLTRESPAPAGNDRPAL
ncbi:O-antigen ligase [Streptomyces sp. B93]|uniref:O-antigen ligase family protein n=1 Tax=Streptomyces sp. B93 TaxID=2824875 RepID=UPI001B399CE7|nr:O-antigen ligase family protein [Streptomyces sp. B93]MBQ1088815.1 O-antigen ligase family protein [Streptomyces sp. B93]